MATLTWRNVDAPDFGSSLRGLAASGAMVDNALSRISEGLSQFRDNQRRTNDQQVIMNSLRYTDPKAYQEALATGAITSGIDPQSVSPQVLASLGSRSGDLLRQAALGQNMESQRYNLDRTRTLDTAGDNARGAAARLYGIQDPTLAALQPQEQAQVASNQVNLAGGRIRNDTSQFNLDTARRDDSDTQTALGIIGDARRNAIDATGARAEADKAPTPGSMFKADEALSRLFPDMYGPGSVGGGTFGNMVQRESGGRQFDKNGKTLTSSKGAQGIAQIMPGTGPEAAELAGLSWDANRLKNDPEYGLALGQAYFNKQKETFGGDEAKAAAAYNAGPGRVTEAIAQATREGNPDAWLSKLPKETRDYVPAVTAGQVNATQADLGVRQMQNVGQQGATTDLFQNLSNTDTVGTVADTLLNSDFKGANRQDVIRNLNDIVSRGNTNPAQAGAILRRNISGASTFNPFSRDFAGTSNLGGNIGFNDQRLEADITAQRTGVNIDQALTNQSAAAVGQGISMAQQASQQAAQQLAAVVRASQDRPQLANAIPRYQQAYERAQQRLTALLENQRTTPSLRAQRPMSQQNQETVSPEQKDAELNRPAPPPTPFNREDLSFGLYD
ncbi:Soluble lytic murein transglycosylase precursor [compost metagenome]